MIMDTVTSEGNDMQRRAIINTVERFTQSLIERMAPERITQPDFGRATSNDTNNPFGDLPDNDNDDVSSKSEDELEDTDNDASESSPVDVQFSAKRYRKTTKKDTGSDTLIPIKLALSSQLGVPELEVACDDFFNWLSTLQVRVRVDNKVRTKNFDKLEAIAITNFFFTEVMGPDARRRLVSLITYYNNHKDELVDVGAGARAERLALDIATPPAIRRFYRSFLRAHRQKINTQTIYALFMRSVTNLELYTK